MEQDRARGSQPSELADVFADLDEQRHWNLISAISTQLAGPEGFPGYEEFATTAAELIQSRVGDSVLVLLTVMPDRAEPAVGYAHPDPERHARVAQLIASMGAGALRAWAQDLARTAPRVRASVTEEDIPDPYARLLNDHVAELRMTDVVYAPLRQPDGTACGFVCATRDEGSQPYNQIDVAAVTAAADTISLALEVALARDEERMHAHYWETAFESGPLGKIVLDAARRYSRINAAGAEILGRKPAELLGLSWPAFSDTPESRQDIDDLRVAAEGGQPPTRVRSYTHPDGRNRWLQRSVGAVLDDAGQVELFHIQFSDVTELYEARAEVSALVRLVESSPDFLAIAELNGMTEYINPAGRELIGLGPDDDVTTIEAVTLYGSPGRPFPLEALADEPEGFWEGQATLRDRRDGSDIPTHARSFLITDPNTGEAVKIGTMQRDMRQMLAITEREREAALAAAELAERRRIATQVHDDALQLLAAAQLRMQLVINDILAGDATTQSADTVADLLAQAQGRLRSLVASAERSARPAVGDRG